MPEPIPPVKGTRDFYPDDYQAVRWILDAWQRVSRRHGFQEYDGPTLEHTELYTRKSGDEIVEQLFTLTDRGGRSLAMRPEMTPTLARMVAARLGSLPRPIKWFCTPRMYRGERPQRGRLREFYQWNIDILGVDRPLADAECILAAVDGLRELGLSSSDFVVRISDRRLMGEVLSQVGLTPEQRPAAFALLDKSAKLPEAELARRWDETFAGALEFARLWELMTARGIDDAKLAALGDAADSPLGRSRELFTILRDFGILEYCEFDLRVVRGLAYYTGVVFEAYDRRGQLRALCGGGRYDDLLAVMGGKPLTGVGFGMGDVVLAELLGECGLKPPANLDGRRAFLVNIPDEAGPGESPRPELLRLAACLRRADVAAEYSYEPQSVSKQVKRGAERGVDYLIFVGPRAAAEGVIEIKSMASGAQREAALAAVLADPFSVLDAPA